MKQWAIDDKLHQQIINVTLVLKLIMSRAHQNAHVPGTNLSFSPTFDCFFVFVVINRVNRVFRCHYKHNVRYCEMTTTRKAIMNIKCTSMTTIGLSAIMMITITWMVRSSCLLSMFCFHILDRRAEVVDDISHLSPVRMIAAKHYNSDTGNLYNSAMDRSEERRHKDVCFLLFCFNVFNVCF
jgi:hypothetical protein